MPKRRMTGRSGGRVTTQGYAARGPRGMPPKA
jgi:hypothetical protein